MTKLGGHLLIDSLVENGADLAFGVPGESYLAAMDGLYHQRDKIRFVICRQEGGAANMADAYGKLTGRPGICFVTRGPGATNASIGVHTAFQDSTPMILLIGQVASDVQDREGFQEVDYRRMFGQMSKWVAQIDRADRIPEYINRAFQIATSGRQGPVVLALPEDMLMVKTDAALLAPYRQNLVMPDPQRIDEMKALLQSSRKPLVLIGGGGWTAQSCQQIEAFTKNWNLPVACAFRFQDVFDNHLPNYAGEVGSSLSPKLRERFQESDLILAIGVRLGEGTTRGYTLLQPPRPKQALIHVHPGAEELGSVYQADVMIQSSLRTFAKVASQTKPSQEISWSSWTKSLNQEYLQHSTPDPALKTDANLALIAQTIQALCPDDTIFCSGAGNYAGWFIRYLRYHGFSKGSRTQIAPSSGAMGYGVPSSVAAKLVHPEKTVISFSGDGCFLMNGQELATAVQENAPVIFIVVNNGMYGTIRMHQEMYFPNRTIGTTIQSPDFAALANAYGAVGKTVTKTAEFEGVFKEALAAKRPYLIEIQTDQNTISTNTTIEQIRAQHERVS